MIFSTERMSANTFEAFLFIGFLLIFAIAASGYVWTKGEFVGRVGVELTTRTRARYGERQAFARLYLDHHFGRSARAADGAFPRRERFAGRSAEIR